MQKGDRVYIKNLEQSGVIQEITKNIAKVKLDTGEVVTTFTHLLKLIQEAKSIWQSIVKIWKSIFKK